MARSLQQLELPARPTWGGRRDGAGRKPTPDRRPGVPHRARPIHHPAHPVHVTLRTVPALQCLRARRVFPAISRSLAAASHGHFRIIEFSVQTNHIHLLVEADDTRALSSGVRGLAIRLARAINRVLGRRGAVFGDRYHARALTTPRAVRHAIVYVLTNRRKHHGAECGLDPCSSAPWFRGWAMPVRADVGNPPVVGARTWLAGVGWRRHGLLRFDEQPSG